MPVVASAPEVHVKAPELRGNNLALGACRDTEVCLTGPAGTGKTFAALYKIHLLLLQYPGAKALVARKNNTALAGSALATYRDMVLDPSERVVYFGGNKAKPAGFQYRNGSFLAVNGLDKRDKIKSWEFDIAYINEATECDLDDIEYVRMRLRNGILPYHQLILDCNPDAPTHWLNQRMNSGMTTRMETRHEDNPRYFDARTGDWTPAGRDYIFGILEGLSGVLYARYRLGLWVAAEGTVYQDSFDRVRNVVERAAWPVRREYPRYLSIDFGYSHPFVCLWAAEDPDGRLIVYRQLYMTHRLVEDHAVSIALASGWYHLLPPSHPKWSRYPADHADPLPRLVICDHDAEDRATFERHSGLYTTPAHKTVRDGIQAVAARFRPAGDGKPRLVIWRGSLYERDEELARMKRPFCLEDEPDSYVWKRDASGAKEEPVKEHDHALDALRYLVAARDLHDSTVSVIRSPWR